MKLSITTIVKEFQNNVEDIIFQTDITIFKRKVGYKKSARNNT